MTSCRERQKQSSAIDHHLAASDLFRSERRWTVWWLTIPIAIACLAPVAAFAADSRRVEVWLAAIAGGLALFGRLVAKPAGAARHREGVAELEARDCHIFNIRWNHGLGDQASRDDTCRRAQAARRALPVEEDRASNWYEFSDAVTPERNVLIAQRSNLAWGEYDHRRWANTLAFLLITVIVAGLLSAGFAQGGVFEYLGLIGFPSVIGWCELWDQRVLHRRASGEKRAKRTEVDRLIERGVLADARELQDDIFRSRLEHPHVPNWFHRMTRDHNDVVMRSVAQQLASQ